MEHNRNSFSVFRWIIILVISFPFLMFLYLFIIEHKTEFVFNLTSILYSGISIMVLVFTLFVYEKLLKVSEQSLTFTKRQTSFNSYFDNYKLFDDLSKRKTSIVLEDDLIGYPEIVPFFESMTFNTIHINYLRILENFPVETHYLKYELLFKRFNEKTQSFIQILYDEIARINTDNNLNSNQRNTLLDLYKNFILFDYINLCKDIIKNNDLLKCNPQDKIVFDTDKFFKLYFELEMKV
ncbi:MAG TPA: hypothetical protein VMT63_11705 [Bacteroidales bacterium]|nr:hypothetical protein [Bacteroidales bacterium]